MFLVNFFKNFKPINKSIPNEDLTAKSSQKTENIINTSISNQDNTDQLKKRFLIEEEPKKVDEKLTEINLNEIRHDEEEKKSLCKKNFHKKLNPLHPKSKLPSIKKRTNSVLQNVSEINTSNNSPVGISDFKDLSSIKYEHNKENKNLVKIKEKKKRKKNKEKEKNIGKRNKSDSAVKVKESSLNKIGVAKCNQKNNTLISIEEEKFLKNSNIFDNIDKILAKSTAYIKKNRESYEKDLIRLYAQNAKLDSNIYFKKIIDNSQNNVRKNYFATKNVPMKKSEAKRLDKSVEHSQNRKKK